MKVWPSAASTYLPLRIPCWMNNVGSSRPSWLSAGGVAQSTARLRLTGFSLEILVGQLDMVRMSMDEGVKREEVEVVWATGTKDRERAVADAEER